MFSVIFDMDGVIFDSEKLVIECWETVAKDHGFTNITKLCIDALGVNDAGTKKLMLDYYGQDFAYDVYAAEVSKLYHERADHGKLPQKTGIKELMIFLKENGVKTAVASSTRSALVKQQLIDGGLFPYFDEIIGGEMTKRSKPAPDIFLLACEKLDTKPEDAYVIEDSFNGIRAASAANIKPIMVPDIIMPDEEIGKLPVAILPSLLEVIDYLKKEI